MNDAVTTLKKARLLDAMNTVMLAMNDERAEEIWLSVGVPDGADFDEILDMASDEGLFSDTCKAFASIMSDYGRGGFCI